MSSSDLGAYVGNAIQAHHVAGERARLEEIVINLKLADEPGEDYEQGYNDALDDVLRYIRPRTS